MRLVRRAEDWRYLTRAALATDVILGHAGIEKAARIAPKILTRTGFDKTVRRLIGKLAHEVGAVDSAAIRTAARALDRRWDTISEAERGRIIKAAADGLLKVPKIITPKVEEILAGDLPRVIAETRKATVAEHRLALGADLNAQDDRVVAYAARSQGSYITDQYGVRAAAFEQKARDIVAHGLEQGYGRDDIASALARDLTDPALGRARAYWDQVASIHVARARSYGQIAAYAEAGLEEYEISTALDEATCVICRLMEGKTFAVAGALGRYAGVEGSDDDYAVEDLQPFIRVGSTEDGTKFLYAEAKGRTHVLAQVVSDASGERDKTGRYSGVASRATMEAIGTTQPPFHGRCRCLTVPVDDED